MKKIFNSWISFGALGLAALALTAACSDDHFEVKSDAAGNQTLWQNIDSNAQLSEFASILKRSKVMKEENDRNAQLTVAQLLDQPQSFTMWAPLNGTFNAKYWEELLDRAEALRKTGTAESIQKARDLEYLVWNQFSSNHIARFNHEGVTGVQEIKLLNGKNTKSDNGVFNSVAEEGTAINASNGSLHLLKGASPFLYNIYDYLSHNAQFSAINAYIKDPSIDVRKFNEQASVPGAMNEYGKMVYIDSVYQHTNSLLDASRAQIRNEDSTYVALIPRDAAWKEALEKVSKIYNYGTRYRYDWDGANFTKEYRLDASTFADKSLTLADSLRKRNVRLNIVSNLFFAPYRIKGYESMDSAALIHHFQYADSLISTAGTTFYNTAATGSTKQNTNLNPTLAGLTPYRASNGYVFELENYNFDPSYIWVEKIEFRPAAASSIYTLTTGNTTYSNGTTVNLTEFNYNRERAELDANGDTVRTADGKPVMIGVAGSVAENAYQRYEMKSPRQNMTVDLRLENVLSAAYQLELVLVPTKINKNDGGEDEKVVFNAEIIDDNKNSIPFTVGGAETPRITIDQKQGQFDPNKVNHILLGDYITFPKCYAGLPADRKSFPMLRLTVPRIGGRNENCQALNIVKVILKPYRGN